MRQKYRKEIFAQTWFPPRYIFVFLLSLFPVDCSHLVRYFHWVHLFPSGEWLAAVLFPTGPLFWSREEMDQICWKEIKSESVDSAPLCISASDYFFVQ